MDLRRLSSLPHDTVYARLLIYLLLAVVLVEKTSGSPHCIKPPNGPVLSSLAAICAFFSISAMPSWTFLAACSNRALSAGQSTLSSLPSY